MKVLGVALVTLGSVWSLDLGFFPEIGTVAILGVAGNELNYALLILALGIMVLCFCRFDSRAVRGRFRQKIRKNQELKKEVALLRKKVNTLERILGAGSDSYGIFGGIAADAARRLELDDKTLNRVSVNLMNLKSS